MSKWIEGELTSELAKPEDVPYVVEIEKETWPAGEDMVADQEKFAIRQKIGGLIVTKDSSGQILGYVSVFKPKWASASAITEMLQRCDDSIVEKSTNKKWDMVCQLYGIPHDWHEATGDGWLYEGTSIMHNPQGKVVFGVGVTTDKKYQGHGVVNKTLSKALQVAAESGAEYFVGFSRLPAFHETEEELKDGISLDEYINYFHADGNGLVVPHDYGFKFHWKLGAHPVQTKSGKVGYVGIPNAMKDDPESKNAGVLIVTPLKCESGSYAPIGQYPFEKIIHAITVHNHIYQPKTLRFMKYKR